MHISHPHTRTQKTFTSRHTDTHSPSRAFMLHNRYAGTALPPIPSDPAAQNNGGYFVCLNVPKLLSRNFHRPDDRPDPWQRSSPLSDPLLFVIPSAAEGFAVRHSCAPPLPAHNLHQITHRVPWKYQPLLCNPDKEKYDDMIPIHRHEHHVPSMGMLAPHYRQFHPILQLGTMAEIRRQDDLSPRKIAAIGILSVRQEAACSSRCKSGPGKA